MDRNRVIGDKNNALPWYLPADLKRFRSVTLGKPIIMGRKTHESIGRPLPERKNIIITRNENFEAPECIVVHSAKDAIKAAGGAPEIMVIGGAEIFAQFLPLAKKLYFTLVDEEFSGTIYFPPWNQEEWKETFREEHDSDEKNPYSYTFVTLEKI